MYKKKERFVLQSEYVDDSDSEEETKPKKPRKLRQNEIFDMKKNTKIKKKMSSLDKKFKEHSKHHSKEHIENMKKDMKNGLSFDEAHIKALEKDKKLKKLKKNK